MKNGQALWSSGWSSRRWTAFSVLLPIHVQIVLRFPVDDVARCPLGKLQLPRLFPLADMSWT